MREAPIILPVFTTSVPLDFPLEGTFAFNKKTERQLEVTVRINEVIEEMMEEDWSNIQNGIE